MTKGERWRTVFSAILTGTGVFLVLYCCATDWRHGMMWAVLWTVLYAVFKAWGTIIIARMNQTTVCVKECCAGEWQTSVAMHALYSAIACYLHAYIVFVEYLK